MGGLTTRLASGSSTNTFGGWFSCGNEGVENDFNSRFNAWLTGQFIHPGNGR